MPPARPTNTPQKHYINVNRFFFNHQNLAQNQIILGYY